MDIFETVKANLDLKTVMESEGIHIGRNHMACCPFHEDKHPSMLVKDTYHCFGCQEHGDVISFIAKRYGLKPIEAARKLAQDYGISIDEEPSPFMKTKIQTMKKKKLWHEKKRDLLHRLQKLSANLNTLKKNNEPTDREDSNWSPLFSFACHHLDYVNYLYDFLIFDATEEEQKQNYDAICKEEEKIEREYNKLTKDCGRSTPDTSENKGWENSEHD